MTVAHTSGEMWNISGVIEYFILREAFGSLLPQQLPKDGPVLYRTWRSPVVGFIWHRIFFRKFSTICHNECLRHSLAVFIIDSTSWDLLVPLVLSLKCQNYKALGSVKLPAAVSRVTSSWTQCPVPIFPRVPVLKRLKLEPTILRLVWATWWEPISKFKGGKKKSTKTACLQDSYFHSDLILPWRSS